MPRGPRRGRALAGQPELCLLRGQPQRPALGLTQPGPLKPEGQEATGHAQQAQHAGGGHRQQGCCWNYFSNQCFVYYFVNWGGGEGRDNLFLNKVEDVKFGPLAMQKEAH